MTTVWYENSIKKGGLSAPHIIHLDSLKRHAHSYLSSRLLADKVIPYGKIHSVERLVINTSLQALQIRFVGVIGALQFSVEIHPGQFQRAGGGEIKHVVVKSIIPFHHKTHLLEGGAGGESFLFRSGIVMRSIRVAMVRITTLRSKPFRDIPVTGPDFQIAQYLKASVHFKSLVPVFFSGICSGYLQIVQRIHRGFHGIVVLVALDQAALDLHGFNRGNTDTGAADTVRAIPGIKSAHGNRAHRNLIHANPIVGNYTD